MNCRQAEKLLRERVLGFIPADKDQTLTEHLQFCSACQRQAEKYNQLNTLLQKKAPVTLPPDFIPRLLRQAEAKTIPRPERKKIFWWVPLTAMAGLVVGFVMLGIIRQPAKGLTEQQVLQEYAEDLMQTKPADIWEEGNEEILDRQTYGIEADVAQMWL